MNMPPPHGHPRRRRRTLSGSGLVAAAIVAGALVLPAHDALAASSTVRPAGPDCPWVTSHASDLARAKQVLAQMTLDEKITLVHGISDTTYAGAVAAVPRLCLPELKLSDGPSGIKLNTPNGNNFDGNTTQLPSETSLAASFDTSMATAYGAVMGQEGKTKGVDVSLSPTINIVRDPRWGRAFESMGEDPYLTGQIASADVAGIQKQGVMAQVKHYAVYNQETNRGNAPDNAIVDDRTVHEIYTAAFGTVVDRADPASVMCSYSWINGTNACENGYLNGILKGEQGFNGFITSDWWGTKSTVAAANAGLDMEMPDDAHFGAALKSAVQAGAVPESRLDDMVTRILREEFRFDLVAHPAPRTPDADAATPAHTRAAQEISEAGTVLLKNTDHTLPLGSGTRSIAVIGDGAGNNALTVGGGSAWAQGSGTVTPLDGITARAKKDDIDVSYAQGYSTIGGGALTAVPSQYLTPSSGSGHGLTGEYYTNTSLGGDPVVTRTDSYVGFDWNGQPPAAGVPSSNFSARWTGTLTAPSTGRYTFSVTSDDGSRLSLDGARVIDNWADQGATTKTYQVDLTAGQKVAVEIEYYQGGGGSAMQFGWTRPGGSTDASAEAVALAKTSDVAVVYANLATSEGSDLTSIDLPADQNALIEAVAKANPRTVVVLNTGSAVTMPWVDDVAGVVEAWYPGQESGNAIASILFGDTNPSGKLPVTFPKSLADVPASTAEQFPGTDGKVEYSEGLDVGYRWYDAKDVDPLFPFGYGLSYTSFRVSGLHLNKASLKEGGSIKATATVTNTGKVAGSDVVQVYLTQPKKAGEPPKSLVGFQKVTLKPGKSTKVSVTIDAQQASVWNTKAQTWALTPGTYTVRAGDSSSSLPTKDFFSVTKTTQPRWVTVKAPTTVTPGKSVTVRTTFTNKSTTTAKNVRTSLDLPDGWTTSRPVVTKAVSPGTSVGATWRVTVPADAKPGALTLGATARYDGGSSKGAATVTVPYASLAAAYDTVGVSDDADETAGNLDGTGYSFSLQALASVGVVPGQAIPGGYGGLVFPQITAGEPNVVSAAGQVVTTSGSGSSLALLAVGTSGEQKGTLTVTYTDGTTSSGAVDVNDWFYNQAVPGSVLVATTPYWNRPAGSTNPHDQKVSLYATRIPLTEGKQVATVTLPTNPELRVFAVHVTD